ncbi:hypothetical protein BANRA_00948 [Acinetobacter baumannii]|nr:hypothetical protein BANRA_00948 [Acinetobacter baumannii]
MARYRTTSWCKGWRNIKSGSATYMWLYRNDQNWLLTFNSGHLSQPQARKIK